MNRLQMIRKFSRTCPRFLPNTELNHETFEEEFAERHIPINTFQRVTLGVGSALVSLANPFRAELIACMGETTGDYAIRYMKERMEHSVEGREILRERPRINSKTIDLEKLKTYPENTLGRVYSDFLVDNNVTPDSRDFVKFIEDVNLAYVMQRYREGHDLIHAVLGMPTNMLGEVTVKCFEGIQTRLPMCIAGGLFGPLRFKPKQRYLFRNYYLPWVLDVAVRSEFILNVYFEKRWEQPISDLHEELGITPLIIPTK